MKPAFAALVLATTLVASTSRALGQDQWWRGNTHTHTLWSDGDAAPEVAVKWYVDHEYDFLVLSDHNQLQADDRWFPVTEEGNGRLTAAHVEELRETFGAENVQLREGEKGREMRLLTLPELRARFQKEGEFTLITGEEVTSHWNRPEDGKKLPVHINAVNIVDYVPPRGGDTVVDVLNDTLDAVAAQSEATGKPMFAHVNHPNFGWGITWLELAQIRADRFFEVYNGHHSVRNAGDDEHPSTEEMWDRALALRLTMLELGPLWGVAVDDSHNWHGAPTSQPGRGWVMVSAPDPSADAIVTAMKRGDFYSSSGVELIDIAHDDASYSITIAREQGVTTTTRFIGVRLAGDETKRGEGGEVLFETQDNPAVYRFDGDELYVRAVVESSKAHPNPFAAGDREMAWTQPVVKE